MGYVVKEEGERGVMGGIHRGVKEGSMNDVTPQVLRLE